MFLFMYGCCCSQYLLPDYKRIPNPFHSVFISCSLFIALCWSGGFTGGHVNPAVTMAMVRKQDGMKWREGALYMASQFVGAIIAAFVTN
jgi:glycerol uptake facilitator-like aquaporin